MITVKVLEEHGYESAMLGLSLSFNQRPEDMPMVAGKLARLEDDSENKFLRQIFLWLDITAPRYWWSQMDTYSVGVTRQSGSTMHSLLKRPLIQEDFADGVPHVFLELLNGAIAAGNLEEAKGLLPESFLQRRILTLNYTVLRRIIAQRHNHKLQEWHDFIDQLQVEHPEFLTAD